MMVDPVSTTTPFLRYETKFTGMHKDLTKRNDNTFGQVRHWLVTKCPVSATGEVIDSDGVVVSPYVKPAPIPAHLFVGYVLLFIIAVQ